MYVYMCGICVLLSSSKYVSILSNLTEQLYLILYTYIRLEAVQNLKENVSVTFNIL